MSNKQGNTHIRQTGVTPHGCTTNIIGKCHLLNENMNST